MKTSLVRSLLLLAACVMSVSAANSKLEAGFKSLFNGKDLTGWDGNPKLWSVQEGTITGKTGTNADNKIKHNTFLVWTNGTVSDFEFRCSYKIIGGNSGVQYRSKILRTGEFGPIVGGYQADFEAGTTYSGILYEEQGRGILAQRGQRTTIKADENPPSTRSKSPARSATRKRFSPKSKRKIGTSMWSSPGEITCSTSSTECRRLM
jgi:hypothetical protein